MSGTAGQPRNFNHPYEPYSIQQDFMDAVYDGIDKGKVSIIESPTGTVSLCDEMASTRNALFKDQPLNSPSDFDLIAQIEQKSDYSYCRLKRREFEDSLKLEGLDSNEPAWVIEHAREQKRKSASRHRDEVEARLARVRAREEKARKRYETGEPLSKRPKLKSNADEEISVEDEFLLQEYESDDGASRQTQKEYMSTTTSLSGETWALLEKLGGSASLKKDEEAPTEELKIFFCSRTHSQLMQFANELRKVKLPPSVPPEVKASEESAVEKETDSYEEIKHVTLGSRKNLCINSKVSRLGTLSTINERCLELQKSTTAKDQKCQFIPTKENEALVNDFRDHTLAKIRDIEDMAQIGKRIGICPYYASRASVGPAEIVTLPYPLLLQKAARESLNLSLKDHIVIIDEAHNLMDAISNIHSSSLSLRQLQLARAQLGEYLARFRNRLKGKNRVYITQLVRVIDSLTAYFEKHEVKVGKGCDQVNLFKLMHYLHESRLARKVEGYASHAEKQSGPTSNNTDSSKPHEKASPVPVLNQVQSFLLALTYPAAEGRFFHQIEGSESANNPCLQYTLLDPTHHFREIVEEARAVILAGGTMSPMSDFTDHLFSYVPLNRISTLSCGHVIPKSNLMASTVARGPGGLDFDFRFDKRQSTDMIARLGQAILEFSKVIPDGVVVFFPSYAYLNIAVQHWQKAQHTQDGSLWSQMLRHKQIFLEPKANQASTPELSQPGKPPTKEPATIDALLTAYSTHIHSSTDSTTGALLLAVIGGSLSEGINFSDRLGRGVVVVGLPFPNPHSSEWAAKLEFISQRPGRGATSVETTSEKSARERSKKAAREFTLNTMMRAVNQSVGRAIRHKNDYAAILLLDRRYESASVTELLPGWIRESVSGGRSFTGVLMDVKTFFDGKKS